VRRHWRDEETSLERYYGLGVISGPPGPWEWFGHGGAFQGFISRTAVVPSRELAVAVATNAIDGWADPWVDGVLHILRRFAEGGAPDERAAGWAGRWWSIWGTTDLVPVGPRVLRAIPAMTMPLQDAVEIEPTGPDEGRVAKTSGFNSLGEPARLLRDGAGKIEAVLIGGVKLVDEDALRREMIERYGGKAPRRRKADATYPPRPPPRRRG
jgi:D-alanyl-D-alanine carboxypeptidase